MVLNEKAHRLYILFSHMHTRGNGLEVVEAVLTMVPRIGLAHVVQQHGEQDKFRPGQRFQQTGEAMLTRFLSVVEIFQVLDRQKGMLVYGIFVKKILNDMAANLVE